MSSDRSDVLVPFRMRTDLRITQQRFNDVRCWCVKDPISLRYHHLTDRELDILKCLDGKRSCGEIREKYESQYGSNSLTPAGFQNLLERFVESAIVEATQSNTLKLIRQRNTIREKVQRRRAMNPLVIRLPGFDPRGSLDWLYPRVSFLFHPVTFLSSLLIIVSAMVLLLSQIEDMNRRLPTLLSLFTVQNLLLVPIIIGGIKVFHELGHGLTCRHFGGECHEMGVMFLFFSPCLYCDVTDIWQLGSKWQRIAVSSAGVYVELVIASFFTIIWWYSTPGYVNQIAFNTMIVCSVGTFLFNANPLLRYDGYHVLADLLEIPNLAQQSRRRLWCLFAVLIGKPLPDPVGSVPTKRTLFLLSYAIASFGYRVFVLVIILVTIYVGLDNWGLSSLFVILAVGLTIPFILAWIRKIRAGNQPKTDNEPNMLIRWLPWLVSGGLIVSFLLLPLPHSVTTPLIIEQSNSTPVFVAQRGTLEKLHVTPGTLVEADSPLLELVNPDLVEEFQVNQRELQRLRRRAENLGMIKSDPEIAPLIPELQQRVIEQGNQLKKIEEKLKQLTIRSPKAGVLISLPPVSRVAGQPSQLPFWSGTPMEHGNKGCTLETGTLVCEIGNPTEFDAVLVVNQEYVDLIKIGQEAAVYLDQWPGQTLSGDVQKVSDVRLQQQTSSDPPMVLPTTARLNRAKLVPENAVSYLIRVRMYASDRRPMVGAIGRAKIKTSPQSLLDRLTRFFRHHFTLGL